jgi:hypothetical protein
MKACRSSQRFVAALFNGKPQALLLDFACASGSPLNENDQYTTESTRRHATVK